MTSDCKIAASRTNGRRSRGPRTAAGKTNSSRNSLRHGLCVNILEEPAACAQVEALARAIAGEGSDGARLSQARNIAAAQIDLERVRDAKFRLLSLPAGLAAWPNGDDQPAASVDSNRAPASEEIDPAQRMKLLKQIDRLWRYESRAISRRSRSIRAFLTGEE